MSNLTILNLSNTYISELPREIGKLIKLKTLTMSQNFLTTLPIEISFLTKLTDLDCSRNILNALPVEIANLTKLKKLNLYDNQLTSLPNLTSLINLTDVSLRYNYLKAKDVVTITSPKLNKSTRHMLKHIDIV